MKKEYTSRLFYGRFPYRVTFFRKTNPNLADYHLGWTPHKTKEWLAVQKINHRIKVSITNKIRSKRAIKARELITTSVYLLHKADYDKLIATWPNDVSSVTEPYSSDHINILSKNTKIIYRNTLIYKKYKYVISFKRHYGDDKQDLIDWIHTSICDPKNPEKVKISSLWNPRLYLTDEADFVAVKLGLSDQIKNIMIVNIF